MVKKLEEKHLIRSIISMHTSALSLAAEYLASTKREVFITPSMFIDTIAMMKSLYARVKWNIESKSQMYTTGVDKIVETQKFIDSLKEMLEKKQPELQIMNQELAVMQVKLDEMEEEVRPIYEKVTLEEAKVNKEFQIASKLKQECEEELKVVNSVLDEAKQAISTISPQDLYIVKSYNNPPNEVKMVMSAICIILNRKPDVDKNGNVNYWPTSKLLLNEGTKLFAKLNTFGEKDLSQKLVDKVRKEFIPHPKFKPAEMENISSAASAFCKWVLAVDKMEEAFRNVLPKREEMRIAEEKAAKMKAELTQKQAELKKYQDKRDELANQKEENEKKKIELEEEIKITQLRYERAVILIEALSEEKVSWEEKLEVMKGKVPHILGDSLLSAGVLVYLGPFSGNFRNKEIAKWIQIVSSNKIVLSEKFSIEESIGDAMEIRKWTIKGLPNDSISREKGLTVYKTNKVPLIIDPQSQANKWIKNIEKDRDLIVTRLDKDDFLRSLDRALSMGKPMLIESVPENIDPVIYPVLMKQTFKDPSGSLSIRIGENVYDYNSNFKCFLTTKIPNPKFQPELTCKVTVINFMITKEGLEDQLLEITVTKERPDLEESRVKIIEQNHNNSIKMEEIENEILTTLKNAEGNILDNESAINTLKRSNVLSQSIKERQKQSAINEALNEEARKVYRKLAYHGMLIYFCCQSLTKVNKTYEYSLSWYNKMYLRAIDQAEKSTFVDQRIDSIVEKLNSIIYSNVCRGLYEKDKIIFSLLLTITILRKETKANENHLLYFVSPFDVVKFKLEASPISWISDAIWRKIKATEMLDGKFMALSTRIINNPSQWENWFNNPKPDEIELPEPFQEATDLERLILLKIFRPEAVIRTLKIFIQNSIGKEFIKSPAFDIEISFSESSFSLPLIFLLPGNNPLTALEAFAASCKKEDIRKISLGQGQGPIAEKEIEEAKITGNWVILENCHLYPSWMAKLSQICEELSDPSNEAKINPMFRLWLTTYPSDDFPLVVLQNSIKMSNMPPEGLSTNLELSYKSNPISDLEGFFEAHPHPQVFKPLVYSLCLFHAIVQERRNFGAIGWNIRYEFTLSDLRVSLLNMFEFTKHSANLIPYKALYSMIGDCNYGGRVTDYHDRRLLQTILQDFITAKIFYTGHRYSELDEYEVPPPDLPFDGYLKFISRLPSEQVPELYGLHSNALISKAIQDTDSVTSKLIEILAGTTATDQSDTSGAGGDAEEKATAPILELLEKIPEKFIEKMVNTKYPVMSEESMNAVLQQEIVRFNVLLSTIKFSLSQLTDALKGDIVMSGELEEMFDSLNQKKVPALWLKVSYPSLKPLASYIDDLASRVKFFNHWIDNGVPKMYWISGFFFTQSFLTGVQQNYARKYGISIDLLDFTFEYEKLITEDPYKMLETMTVI
jgi:dynein heavy chain